MKPTVTTALAILFILTIFAHPAPAVTIHVPSEEPTIQAGIDAAVDGDIVLVAEGSYVENIIFEYKSIEVRSESGPELTTIDGNYSGPVVFIKGEETDDAILNGFTLVNGEAYNGGGIFCEQSNVTINDCQITFNKTEGRGGGIFFVNSSPTITECYIFYNEALDGGGIYCEYSSSPMITNCTISENKARGDGGGIVCYDGDLTITSCTIKNNSADYDGGGIDCGGNSPTITNCTITGNTAVNGGGGIILWTVSDATITNCTISANTARLGGGISCTGSPDPIDVTITNCIFWGDSASGEGPEMYLFMSIGEYSTHVEVHFSDVQGGRPAAYIGTACTLLWPPGNIDEDPQFVGGGDYHITHASPCKDAGMDAGVDDDIDGDWRPQFMGFDMGSDEIPGHYTLVQAPYYAAATLFMAYTLGTLQPADWLSYLILTYPQIQVIKLWSVSLPVIDPPIDFQVSFPLPSMGTVGLWTALYQSGNPLGSSLVWVDTSQPG